MRGRMNDAKSYAAPQPLGAGDAAAARSAKWSKSKHPKLRRGDKVVGMGGWQEYSVVDGGAAGRAAQGRHDARAAVGLPRRGRHAGRDGVVRADRRSSSRRRARRSSSARASGAVGSVVGAARQGARLPRGRHRRRRRTSAATSSDELGFDACVDYKAHPDRSRCTQALKAATARTASTATSRTSAARCFDAVLPRMNAFGRIALCGMIAGYDGEPMPLAQPQLFLQSRLQLAGLHRQRAHGGLARGAERARRRWSRPAS